MEKQAFQQFWQWLKKVLITYLGYYNQVINEWGMGFPSRFWAVYEFCSQTMPVIIFP